MEGDTRMLSFFHGAARLISMQASIPKLDVQGTKTPEASKD
jgi:hypothetical protein